MSSPSRQEPILAVDDLPEDVEPLLLTKLVREGLPPPLWHGSRNSADQHEVADDRQAAAQPMQEPVVGQHEAVADAFPGSVFEQASPEANAAMAAVPAETTVAPAVEAEPASADRALLAEGVRGEDRAPHTTSPADTGSSEPKPAVEDRREQGAASMEEADLAEALERIRNLSFHYGASPAEEAPAPGSSTPAPESAGPALDMQFLQEFETLLFQEVERRVLSELEERLTQHLQKVWKEQVSIAVLRALSLEGIRLRESISKELQESLPQILQQVLHEGFDQALHPDISDEDPKQGPQA